MLKQWKIAVLWVEARSMSLWYALALVAVSYSQTFIVYMAIFRMANISITETIVVIDIE